MDRRSDAHNSGTDEASHRYAWSGDWLRTGSGESSGHSPDSGRASRLCVSPGAETGFSSGKNVCHTGHKRKGTHQSVPAGD